VTVAPESPQVPEHEVVGGSPLERAAVAAALAAARARAGDLPVGGGHGDPLEQWRRSRRSARARTPERTARRA
jgi:hypothetical protein